MLAEDINMKDTHNFVTALLSLLAALFMLAFTAETHADRRGEEHWAPPGKYYGPPHYSGRRGPGYRPHHRPYYHKPYYPAPYYWNDAYKIDADPYKYLSLTAIALKLLDNLDAQQQRRHESAMAAATRAPIGEAIVWQEGNAAGSVRTTRIGQSASGLQCREFQHTVTIGGKTQQAYGTSCLQPDGSWKIISAP